MQAHPNKENNMMDYGKKSGGMHKMPNGKMMANSAMPKKTVKKMAAKKMGAKKK